MKTLKPGIFQRIPKLVKTFMGVLVPITIYVTTIMLMALLTTKNRLTKLIKPDRIMLMASTFFKKRAEKLKADKLPSENKSTDELLKTLETAEQDEVVQDEEPKQKEAPKQEAAVTSKPVIQTGYNVFFDSGLKKYMLVYLEYSPGTISAQVVKMEPIADNMAVALKKLSDKIALKLMRHEEDV